MGVNYTDDISGKPLDSKLAYQMQFTKFESDKKLIKTKKFYISLETLKSTVGDQDLGWITLLKNEQNEWIQQ